MSDPRAPRAQHRFWRTPDEPAAGPPEAEPEFAAPAVVGEGDRRSFVKFMAASMALAGLAGCGPDEEAVPYVEAPERIVPGQFRSYATAVPFAGYAQPVIGRTTMGRPVKLEANVDHPLGIVGTDAFTQAAILALYDPDRSKAPLRDGRETAWSEAVAELTGLSRMLDARQGQGLRILTGAVSSPTLARQLKALQARWPQMRWHVQEPFDTGSRYAATRLAFGRPLEMHPALEQAEVIVAFDDDVLGPGPHQAAHTRRWADGRRQAQAGAIRRLHMVEPVPTLTGIRATTRRRVPPSMVGAHVMALAAALGEPGAVQPADPDLRAWATGMADELRAHRGRALILAGAHLPPEWQALCLRLNGRLGAFGTCLGFTEPVLEGVDETDRSLRSLAQDMQAGQAETLVVLDSNPVYAAPADLRFAEALGKVRQTIHAGLAYDETAAYSHLHLPLAHALDGWGDLRSRDGTASLVQPLVKPFYDVRSVHEVVAMLAGDPGPDGREIVRATWRAAWQQDGDAFEARWRQALADGFVKDTASPAVTPTLQDAPVPAPADGARPSLELVILPDPTIWDGRLANLAWLQELPKPITKLTWENVVAVAPAFAREHGLENGDHVRLEANGGTVEGPAWIVPGQAQSVVAVTTGYGRLRVGRVGDGLGFAVQPLQASGNDWTSEVTLTKLDKRSMPATTQPHHRLEGDDFIRTVAHGSTEPVERHPSQPSMYPPWPEGERQWGMTIDLDLCTGCNACVTACQAENNIAVVGKEQVAMGREMFWLRVDHYYEGDPDDPKASFQPVPCMHCEEAPCEMGCPVNATVHDSEGLNDMVYNRCIGTRTCSAYCPYKVRHFNWFDWTANDPASIQAQRNPNVTVRSRGVMEKCTYCVQRISEARITAKKEQRQVRDGEVMTACQQACPAGVFSFGNLADRSSEVTAAKESPRNYALLDRQGTKPRTTYLAMVEDGPAGTGEG